MDESTKRRLFVGGLYDGISEKDLTDRFSRFGNIDGVDIRCRKDDTGAIIKTFAYLDTLMSETKFKQCMCTFNNTKWKGNTVQIQVAKESFMDRLKRERQQNKEETPKVKAEPKPEELYVKGAVPGTQVEGKANWVVGKYGRALPMVNIRTTDKKKVIKVDPSKYVHGVKMFDHNKKKGEPAVEPETSVSNLTWQIEKEESETVKKIKGEFKITPKRKSRREENSSDSESDDTSALKKVRTLYDSTSDSELSRSNGPNHEEPMNVKGIVRKRKRTLSATSTPDPCKSEPEHESPNVSVIQTKRSKASDILDNIKKAAQVKSVKTTPKATEKKETSKNISLSKTEKTKKDPATQGNEGVNKSRKSSPSQKYAKKTDSDNLPHSYGHQNSSESTEFITKVYDSTSSEEEPQINKVTLKASKTKGSHSPKPTSSIPTSIDNTEKPSESMDKNKEVKGKKARNKNKKMSTTIDIKYVAFDDDIGAESDDEEDDDAESERQSKRKKKRTLSSASFARAPLLPQFAQMKGIDEFGVGYIMDHSAPNWEDERSSRFTTGGFSSDEDLLDAVSAGKTAKLYRLSKIANQRAKFQTNFDSIQDSNDQLKVYNSDSEEAGGETFVPISSTGTHKSTFKKTSLTHKEIPNGKKKQKQDMQKKVIANVESNRNISKIETPNAVENRENHSSKINSVKEEQLESSDSELIKDKSTSSSDSSSEKSDSSGGENVSTCKKKPSTGKPSTKVKIKVEQMESSSESDSSSESEEAADRRKKGGNKGVIINVHNKPLVDQGNKSHSGSQHDSETSKSDSKPALPDNKLTAKELVHSLGVMQKDVGKSANNTKKHVDDNAKRLEALKQRTKEAHDQKKLLQQALASIDSESKSNRIVFNSDSEDDVPEKPNKNESSTVDKSTETSAESSSSDESSDSSDESDDDTEMTEEMPASDKPTETGLKLFGESEESSEDEDEEERFKIKPQYEGPSGAKLMSLQTRLGNDPRFKMSAAFLEDEDAEDEEHVEKNKEKAEEPTDVDKERDRALEILKTVVGNKATKMEKREKSQKFRDIGSIRYDPTTENHEQFEVKMEEKTKATKKKKKKVIEEISVEEAPEVSSERFFEVQSNLKEAFSTSNAQPFSMLAMLGREEDELAQKQAEQDDGKGTVLEKPKMPWHDNFTLDTSDEEDQSRTQSSNDKKGVSKLQENAPTRICFFFKENDTRIQDGLETFRQPKDMEKIREEWAAARPDLVESYRMKRKRLTYQSSFSGRGGTFGGRGRGRGGTRGGRGR